jgi:hypothetical protein
MTVHKTHVDFMGHRVDIPADEDITLCVKTPGDRPISYSTGGGGMRVKVVNKPGCIINGLQINGGHITYGGGGGALFHNGPGTTIGSQAGIAMYGGGGTTFAITVEGDANKVQTAQGDVTITKGVKERVHSSQGEINIGGDACGSISSSQGNIRVAGHVYGNCSSKMGNIDAQAIQGNASSEMGSINGKRRRLFKHAPPPPPF